MNKAWNPVWEEIYQAQRELNKYPHHYVVSFCLRNFRTLAERQACSVLEVGCGAGNNVRFLLNEGFKAAGLDGATTAIKVAKERIDADGHTADMQVGDFTHLPWADNSFDLVIDRGSLTCVSHTNLLKALDEVKRVLRPNGRFFSMIYSDLHPGIAFGQLTEPYTYDNFSDGYFKGHGTLTVCNKDVIDQIYATRFDVSVTRLTQETDYMHGSKPVNAIWCIEARKK